ncbi:transcriptional regulator, HxlR family [Paenibacillus sophorae]|uniref:Helix-turn-helix transcriptional regulator n=1 Tax=Paenibacillus sophorae TaxID=1333845 RepID=A0A1H8SAJ5_9BACL|nr:helix-turn-helix domain-containing protein [Paenibacillus sophorae]QWU16807.1 helix-turn-helix transcriptional regulator [Paenibacillus sophorae]SEO75615.1 transcriptional regulator, HxlR family [Paenibacillus sophorae]
MLNPPRKKCPVETTLDVISGKWKGVIIYHLLSGTKRFNELRRIYPQVTHHTLTLQLRDLEREGIIERKSYNQVPPKVEYSLTEFGKTLEPIILLMKEWGDQYDERVSQSHQMEINVDEQLDS